VRYVPAAGEPWSRLHTRYDFFRGAEAAVGMARVALSQNVNVQDFLNSVGLSPALTETGFAEIMHAAGLSILRITPVTTARERLEVVRRWCLGPSDKLFFPNWRKEMARALALPFGNQMPAQADRDIISNFLVGRFGDPRTKRSARIGLDDVADVLKRWLTEQSLRQFFDVVDKIAPDGAWKYRRKFWLAYHNQGLVRNAWVVFGTDGAAEAQRSFGKEALFGVFNSAGRKPIQKGHAVLLLDFGQCIVADWSYDGYCNIWSSSGSIKAPALNLTRYSSDDVTERTQECDRSGSAARRVFGDFYSLSSRLICTRRARDIGRC
jgi:EH_Signature domain